MILWSSLTGIVSFLIRNSIASHILNSFQCRQFLETGSTGFLDLDLFFFLLSTHRI